MIKIGIRHNLLYPIMSVIFTFLRKADNIAMSKINFKGSLSLTLIMFLSEIISGLIFFYYRKTFTSQHKMENQQILGIKLIQRKSEYKVKSSKQCVVFLLIFIVSLIDIFEYLIDTYFFPKFKNVSGSLYDRLRSILTVFSGFFSFLVLKIPIYRHQKFSLIIILIGLLIIIITEFIYESKEGDFYLAFFITILNYFADSFFDITEKYVLETYSLDPFQVLFFEGIFGLLLTCIYICTDFMGYINDIFHKESDTDTFLLIIYLILYFVLCGGRNIYRILTNKIYFPITRSFTDSIFDPVLVMIYFYVDQDFRDNNGNESYPYFLTNLIISIIYVFFGAVYNEVFVLYCCKLEYDTHYGISERASIIDN